MERDLNDLLGEQDPTLTSATAINDQGEIVAFGGTGAFLLSRTGAELATGSAWTLGVLGLALIRVSSFLGHPC